MNRSISKRLVTAVLSLAFSQAVFSETRAVSCNGCSDRQMKQTAAKAANYGFVYVFNASARTVKKYRLATEVVDFRPYTTFTSAWKLPVETPLKNDWVEYLHAVENLVDPGFSGTIALPPDFPVRSVAGALIDPDSSTTAIEDFLLTLPEHHQLALTLNTLTSRALDLKLPLVDLRSVIRETTLTFEFPDGSTMDYSVDFTADQISLAARTELTPEGNARTADGSAAPRSAVAFRGRRFEDNGGSLIEWVSLARSYGIRVSGRGTSMECYVDNLDIHCVVSIKR